MSWKQDYHVYCLDNEIPTEIAMDVEMIPGYLNQFFLPKMIKLGYRDKDIRTTSFSSRVYLHMDLISKNREFSITVQPDGSHFLSPYLFRITTNENYGNELSVITAYLGKREFTGMPLYPEFMLHNYPGNMDKKVKGFSDWFFGNMPDNLNAYISGKDWTREFAFNRDDY